MEALQYIYTSWKNGDSTEKGYMIYSRSEGISDVECNAIKDAMQYLAPKGLPFAPTSEEIEKTFPYSFSYFVLPTGRGCIAQSTYLGKDYSGRFGNYIIYALVFNIEELPCRPAEFFSESYMKTFMTEEELNASSPVPPLPPLDITEYSSVINEDEIIEFVSEKEDEFAQLIALMLAACDAGVPFYLNDTRENLVLWSAAVSRMLPLKLSRKFMFNTYVGDHEGVRRKLKERGIEFLLTGVRPDANYFNYASECRSSSHYVMDFIDGNMTTGITPSAYALAMAESLMFDCEEADSFGEFIESTSFGEINGKLNDAYLYYNLLKNDEFEFNDADLKGILDFGFNYCSESYNSEAGSKLLVKCREEQWNLSRDLFVSLWKFVCKYAEFMLFSMYELLTDTVYQQIGDSEAVYGTENSVLGIIKNETPSRYKEYLDYINTENGISLLNLYLTDHSNVYANSYYISWLIESFGFVGGIFNEQPASKLMVTLLKNIVLIKNSEKQMIDILITASSNSELFENIISVFMTDMSSRVDALCESYIRATEALSEREINRFEGLLFEIPGAASIGVSLSARKIASSAKPHEEYRRFFENHRERILRDREFAIDPIILACIKNTDEKNREEIAFEIVRKIDPELINLKETIVALTDAVNRATVKTLVKEENDFLERVCILRAKADGSGIDKVKMVFIGKMLEKNNRHGGKTVDLSGKLLQLGVNLSLFEKSDYEAYVKSYFEEFFVLIGSKEDVSSVMKLFYNSRWFAIFTDDYISALKKLDKKDNGRWRELISSTCVFLVSSERGDAVADELHRPLVRYLRTLGEEQLTALRADMIREVSGSRCDYLFEEVRRKEGLSEKLSNLFKK